MAIQEPLRRKKKKKQGGNGTLIVLLAVGGLFVIGGIILLIILLTQPGKEGDPNKQLTQGTTTGQKKAKEPEKKKPDPEEPVKDVGTKKRPDNYRLRINRIERKNELRNIGQLYTAYQTDFGRPPGKVEDFLKYIERDSQTIHKAIQEKYYVLLPNVRSGIVAYEFDPDRLGQHGTTDISGVVEEMSSEELLRKLKAQGN